MLFKKRINTEEVAEQLRLMHASAFSDHALDEDLKSANAVLCGEAHAKATWEYFIFGIFVVTKTMSDALEGKVVLRDEILDRFYENVYFWLQVEGLEGRDHKAFQQHVRERLSQYYAAWQNLAEPGPVYWLGKAVSSNVLGNKPNEAYLLFTIHAWANLRAFADFVKKLLGRYRIPS